jgi:hypothetical protein
MASHNAWINLSLGLVLMVLAEYHRLLDTTENATAFTGLKDVKCTRLYDQATGNEAAHSLLAVG